MPEGPEVKLITNCLNKYVKKHILLEIKTTKSYTGLNDFKRTLPAKVKAIEKKGKFMYWVFDNKFYMLNHLMMTGSWSINKDTYTIIEFVFDNITLYYSDKRKFGRIEFIADKEKLLNELNKLGPDMMDSDITAAQFLKLMRENNKKNIGVAMMSQDIVSGIGNYLRSEILYLCKISPHKKIKDLSDQQIKNIYLVSRNLLETSYNLKGCSLQDFKDLNDEEGKFQKYLKVYKKKKDEYGHTVINEKINGRSVFWVKEIQT